jgi:hypothetical protein
VLVEVGDLVCRQVVVAGGCRDFLQRRVGHRDSPLCFDDRRWDLFVKVP